MSLCFASNETNKKEHYYLIAGPNTLKLLIEEYMLLTPCQKTQK